MMGVGDTALVTRNAEEREGKRGQMKGEWDDGDDVSHARAIFLFSLSLLACSAVFCGVLGHLMRIELAGTNGGLDGKNLVGLEEVRGSGEVGGGIINSRRVRFIDIIRDVRRFGS